MRRYAPILFVVAALAVAGLTIFGTDGLPKLRALERSLTSQKEANVELYQQVRGLKREVAGIQNDDRVLEKAARNELGMSKPGEEIYVFERKDQE